MEETLNLASGSGMATGQHTSLAEILHNAQGKYPLHERFRALFMLKNLADDEAVHVIAEAFKDRSDLLRHELAYVMGQMRNRAAIPMLMRIVEDRAEYSPIVRHEAAEALGAIGESGDGVLDLLERHLTDPDECTVVKETCELAIDLLKFPSKHKQFLEKESEFDHRSGGFTSVDPAPALEFLRGEKSNSSKDETVAEMGAMMMNTKLPLFQRYRAMFSLRNAGTAEAVLALAEGLKDKSALFRHEIAYVFGQLQHPASVPALVTTLSDTKEEGMVRHECAEALGSIASPEVLPILQKFTKDESDVVAQSCVVALDMYEYENSGDLEYVADR